VFVRGEGSAAAFRTAFKEAGIEVLRETESASPAFRVECQGGSAQVFQAAADAGLVLTELRPASASLEEVFARLTTNEAGKGAEPITGVRPKVEERESP
ncbi:MAG: hypothetical protein AAF645_28115, partial [Myxococcota bacterium]